MKIRSLTQYLICLLTTACQGFVVGPDQPEYFAIFSYGKELKQNYDLQIVGFGGGGDEGKNILSATFLGSQTPDLGEARSIFYDVSVGFLERLNSNEQLLALTVGNLYTIDNLEIMIMFPKVENHIVTVAHGRRAGYGDTQFVMFFTYDAQTGKSEITYREPYEELKRIVEQQRCSSQYP